MIDNSAEARFKQLERELHQFAEEYHSKFGPIPLKMISALYARRLQRLGYTVRQYIERDPRFSMVLKESGSRVVVYDKDALTPERRLVHELKLEGPMVRHEATQLMLSWGVDAPAYTIQQMIDVGAISEADGKLMVIRR